jgi:SagB-type dehydrogenase family enzyme
MIGGLSGVALDDLVTGLSGDGVAVEGAAVEDTRALGFLSQNGFLEFHADGVDGQIVLTPCQATFDLRAVTPLESGVYKMARLAYMHAENGGIVVRHPAVDCFLLVNDSQAIGLLSRFRTAVDIAELCAGQSESARIDALCGLFARAGVIQPCNEQGLTDDDSRPERRQWDFHDALFHSRARLGRTEKPIGATWRFKGVLEQAPAIKTNPWTSHVIALPRPNIEALMRHDMPLAMAIETRRSIRDNSVIPLSGAQLGEFLFRTVRVRSRQQTPDGDFVSKPHPGGGAIYENEIYVTVNQCLDVPRGFYYYDPVRHALCLVSWPDWHMEGLLQEAQQAMAGVCRPQILFTIASRHTRFNWKYSGMSYSAQLKNVGVIYQTMYLVATSMGIGGCALGLGNTDRFCTMTGLDWFEEGSVGEFMIVRRL